MSCSDNIYMRFGTLQIPSKTGRKGTAFSRACCNRCLKGRTNNVSSALSSAESSGIKPKSAFALSAVANLIGVIFTQTTSNLIALAG